jgi:hypothetical protein
MTVAPPDIIGRDEARTLGLKRYFTGKPCKRGRSSTSRSTLDTFSPRWAQAALTRR